MATDTKPEEALAQLCKFKGTEELERALAQEAPLYRQLEGFYGIEMDLNGVLRAIGPADIQKTGKRPDTLLEIIRPFIADQTIIDNPKSYEHMREEFRDAHKHNTRRGVLSAGGTLGGAWLTSIGIIGRISDMPTPAIAIPIVVGGIIAAAAGTYYMRSEPKPSDFIQLRYAAQSIDTIIEQLPQRYIL